MTVHQQWEDDDPMVWVREGRGGSGYGARAVGRIVRCNSDGRVTISVFREDDGTWVIRSVGREELQRPAADERRRLEELELQAARNRQRAA